MIEIPKSIHIGCFNINVEYVKNLSSKRDCFGEWHPGDNEIHISEDIKGKQQAVEVFLHEIIEAIMFIYDLDIKHHNIAPLSSGICQALGLIK